MILETTSSNHRASIFFNRWLHRISRILAVLGTPTTGLPYTHDFWLKCPLFWLRFHYEPRTTLFTPRQSDLIGGPSLEDLGSQRMTLLVTSVGHSWKHNTWNFGDETVSGDCDPFTGLTLFDLVNFLRLTWTRQHMRPGHFMFQRNQLHRNVLSTS